MKNWALLSILTLSSCIKPAPDNNGIACTEEFRTIAVVLVDSKGKLVENATTYTFNLKGDTLVTNQKGFFEGSYTVLSDNERSKIGSESSVLYFYAKTDSLHVNASFYAKSDACHIN